MATHQGESTAGTPGAPADWDRFHRAFPSTWSGTHPTPSLGGILWIAATFIAVLLLAFGKRVTGKQFQNEVQLTEGRVTLVDVYLAGAVLVGLLLNALFSWWWADPLASLVIVYYGIREAIHALRESGAHG